MISKIKAFFTDIRWTKEDDFTISQTSFETAVGKKECQVQAFESQNSVRLQAEYFREGQNVCSTCLVLIDKGDSEDTIREKISSFKREVISFVNASYARKLFINSTIKNLYAGY